jgi:hypothetical protein
LGKTPLAHLNWGGYISSSDVQEASLFAVCTNVSLEELVPPDHFYRHLERTLDLSFVREFVHESYAQKGRPSIDPVVFFKLQLVMFFEGIRSERQLMQHAADRLSVLWYLGYDLGEPLPDHSSLTPIPSQRWGILTVAKTSISEVANGYTSTTPW